MELRTIHSFQNRTVRIQKRLETAELSDPEAIGIRRRRVAFADQNRAIRPYAFNENSMPYRTETDRSDRLGIGLFGSLE